MIKPIDASNRDFVDRQIKESWAGPYVVSRGVLHDTRTLDGFAAYDDGEIAGYIMHNITGDDCEIVVLECLKQDSGHGTALINAVIKTARDAGCRRVWLVTTNDNTHAIRFYQRFGFELSAVHIGAIVQSRKLKPQIPLTGSDDIPIKHEFEFEIVL